MGMRGVGMAFDLGSFKRDARRAAAELQESVNVLGDSIDDAVSDTSARVARQGRFTRTGIDLAVSGMVTSHGGNLSETDGRAIWITRTDSMLGHLGADDIIETGWQPGLRDEWCSRELVVHRAMYRAVRSLFANDAPINASIVHAHARHTVALSLMRDVIVPVDSEGIFTFGDAGVAVLAPGQSIGSAEAAQMLAEEVAAGRRIAVIRGHGPFAIAPTMAEAYRLVSVLEASCHIACLCGRL